MTAGAPLMLREVDELLNELASFSKWSDEQRQSADRRDTL